MSKETILKELKKKDILSQTIMLNWIRSETNITFTKEIRFYKLLKNIVIKEVEEAIDKTKKETREEIIREEIAYWIDVFDNRPKDRDLESDNIAQNFARIEIERLENKLKK